MKKIIFTLLLLVTAFTFTSCGDDCTQPALCTLVVQANSTFNLQASVDKVTVCHVTGNGSYQTIEINLEDLSFHLSHGDTEGECPTLSDGGLVFRDGEVVDISCDYSLPFIHTDENGNQWLYTEN